MSIYNHEIIYQRRWDTDDNIAAAGMREIFHPFPDNAERIKDAGDYTLFLLPAEGALLIRADDVRLGFLVIGAADLREIVGRLEGAR